VHLMGNKLQLSMMLPFCPYSYVIQVREDAQVVALGFPVC
jgi:hypothetical protein